jgi:multimeric flavodoxin WrbA
VLTGRLGGVPTLLVVHHTPSPATQAMLEAVRDGAADPELEGVDVVVRPALGATVSDLLAADGVVLGTPANIGYMSGALKHFFDTVYYPVLEATVGLPYGLYVHGQSGTGGAVRSVETVTGALRWKAVAPVLEVAGEPSREQLAACRELGATVAVTLLA